MNHRMTYFAKSTNTNSQNNQTNKNKFMDILNIPDLCYLVKETQTKKILNILSKNKKITKTGLYHYVYGLNTSNVALISAYISKYIQKKHNQTNYRIIQSVFCIFDFFFEKDLRILIKFPGGVKKIFYIDDTEATEVQAEGLRTAFLSSILRMWCFNQTNVPSNALFLEEVNNIQTFDYLCECIEWLIINQAKTHLFNIQKVNCILKYFIKYLLSTRRYTFAISFFNKLLHYDLNFAQFAIKPLKLLNLYNDTMTYLAKLCTDPNIEDTTDSANSYMCNYNINSKQNPKLLWLEIEILTKLKQYDDALKIAKYVTSMTPKNIEAWLALAELYLKMNQHENFLRALNNIFIMDNNNNSSSQFFGKDEYNTFGFISNLYNYNKKAFSMNEIPISFGNQKGVNFNQNIFNSEHKYNKKIIELLGLKINDLFSKQKNCIDIFYSANKYDQFNIFTDIHDESEDFYQHITIKILNSNYVSFSHIQKKIYNLILTLIKEINFDPFMTLRKKIFSTVVNNQSPEAYSPPTNNENNSININDLLSGKENSSLNSNFNQIQSYSLANEMKLLMNPNLELIIETLIEDLKIFSIVMNSNFSGGEISYQATDMNNIQGMDNNTNSMNDKNNNALGNENTLNIIKSKDELTIKEIKFCLSFALLNERLGYKSTALNLYTKAQENCFSRFLLMRKIKIFIEERNYKQAILSLSDLLSFIKEEEFNYVNKTPLWIDNIILKTLFEFQVNDIMEWLDDCEEYIWEYIKKIVNKYKYWIDVGQDIYLVK
jgi:hypothetical protein